MPIFRLREQWWNRFYKVLEWLERCQGVVSVEFSDDNDWLNDLDIDFGGVEIAVFAAFGLLIQYTDPMGRMKRLFGQKVGRIIEFDPAKIGIGASDSTVVLTCQSRNCSTGDPCDSCQNKMTDYNSN